MLGIKSRTVLCRIKHNGKYYNVYMQEISEAQEKELDAKESVNLLVGDDVINVSKDSIYCYGEIDSTNKEDARAIFKFNLVNEEGTCIHTNINEEYKTVKPPKFVFSTNPLLVWDYSYTVVGRPKRVIVYRQSIVPYGIK